MLSQTGYIKPVQTLLKKRLWHRWQRWTGNQSKLPIKPFSTCQDPYCRSIHLSCSVKKVFLKFSQNSQGNACARVSFLLKLQPGGLQLYLKRDSDTSVFPWILRNFLKAPFLQNTSGWLLQILPLGLGHNWLKGTSKICT